MKTIVMSVKQAKELYTQNPQFRNTILSTFTDEELGIEVVLRDWKELDFKNTYYPKYSGKIDKDSCSYDWYDKHLNTPTENHAKSILAFAKLSMLMADLGEECKVDWNDKSTPKYCIECYPNPNTLNIEPYYITKHFLTFKTKKTAERFRDKHRELIKDYYGY